MREPYLSEFTALISSEAVPLEWRRMFAVTTYLYARAGEVNALRWEDVDLERGVVHVHASVNRDTGTRKSTKTGDARRVRRAPRDDATELVDATASSFAARLRPAVSCAAPRSPPTVRVAYSARGLSDSTNDCRFSPAAVRPAIRRRALTSPV